MPVSLGQRHRAGSVREGLPGSLNQVCDNKYVRIQFLGLSAKQGPRAKKESRTNGPRKTLLFLPALMVFLLWSCSGNQQSPGMISITPPSANVPIGQKEFFVATVTGGMDPRVVWEVNGVPGGNSTVGTIDASGSASGLIGAYTAPAAIPAPPSVTVSAVSQSDPMLKASVAVRIGPLVSISPLLPSVQTYASLQFSASVTGVSNTAVTWQVSCEAGGSACGGISQSGLYRAPNSVPTAIVNDRRVPDRPTVMAISQADRGFFGSAPVIVVSLNQQRQAAPIKLGTSGSNGNDTCVSNNSRFCTAATLGALLTRGGKEYVLSNSHVLVFTDKAGIGDPIVHPGLSDTGFCEPALATTVASLSEFVNIGTAGNPVDAAIAEVAGGAVDSTGLIIGLGDSIVDGVPQPGAPAQGSGVAASPNQPVAKSGRATGVTCANVEAVSVSIQVQFEKVCPASTFTRTFHGQITVGGSGFSAGGDSGSLIVDANTAEPVALFFASGGSTSAGTPVSSVLNVFKDSNNNVPTFVGGAPHVVAACSLPPPSAAAPSRAGQVVPAEAIGAAEQVKNRRGYEILRDPAVVAVGVGESLDAPGEAAIIVFVQSGVRRVRLPAELDGIRTRIIESRIFPPRGLLNQEETQQLISQAEARRPERLPTLLVESAKAVKEKYAAGFLADPAIAGIGVSASLDSPGDPALILYVLEGQPHRPIPATINGLQTRIKATSGFYASVSRLGNSRDCVTGAGQ